jgi:hypothetical protein
LTTSSVTQLPVRWERIGSKANKDLQEFGLAKIMINKAIELDLDEKL